MERTRHDTGRRPLIPGRLPRGSADKFYYTRLNDGREHGEYEHILHPKYTALDRDIAIDNTVTTIVASDQSDYYSVLADISDSPSAYELLYENVKQTAGKLVANDNPRAADPRKLILEATYQTVRDSMKTISHDESIAYVREHVPNDEPNTLVSLSAFLNDGVGSSEHQSLVAAAALDHFIQIGGLEGNVSVDSAKRILNRQGAKLEHNSWVRFTDPSGSVTIIDPARGFSGRLHSSLWRADVDYLREEDAENPLYNDTVQELLNQDAERKNTGLEGKARKIGRAVLNIFRTLDTVSEEKARKAIRRLTSALDKSEESAPSPTPLHPAQPEETLQRHRPSA